MGDWVVPVVLALLAASVVCFSVRRLLLLAVALLPAQRRGENVGPPLKLTLLVPARNEGPAIERTLEALNRLTYPSGSLFVVLWTMRRATTRARASMPGPPGAAACRCCT